MCQTRTELCPTCHEPELYRIRDGTAARVCIHQHVWQTCQGCDHFYNPNVTKKHVFERGCSMMDYLFLCPSCASIKMELAGVGSEF